MISTTVCPSPSLFCRKGFREQRISPLRPEQLKSDLSFAGPHARQATSAHSASEPKPLRTALQVSNLFRTQFGNTTMGVRLRTITGLHGNRVGVTMPLEIALNPQVRENPHFPPAPTQHWAYQASTRGFIVVPLRGFLGPPSETAVLTRILRRRLAVFSIPPSR